MQLLNLCVILIIADSSLSLMKGEQLYISEAFSNIGSWRSKMPVLFAWVDGYQALSSISYAGLRQVRDVKQTGLSILKSIQYGRMY